MAPSDVAGSGYACRVAGLATEEVHDAASWCQPFAHVGRSGQRHRSGTGVTSRRLLARAPRIARTGRWDRGSGAGVVEEDLGDAGGLFQRGEVSRVWKRDRMGTAKQGDVGFTLSHARPVVV